MSDDGIVLLLDYGTTGRHQEVRAEKFRSGKCPRCKQPVWGDLPPGALHAPVLTAEGVIDCSLKVVKP